MTPTPEDKPYPYSSPWWSEFEEWFGKLLFAGITEGEPPYPSCLQREVLRRHKKEMFEWYVEVMEGEP